MLYINKLNTTSDYYSNHDFKSCIQPKTARTVLPRPRLPQLFYKVLLLVGHPVQFQLLFYGLMFLQTETDGVPARHDVVSDDAAQRVRHDGHFASPLLELRVPRAEKSVQSI